MNVTHRINKDILYIAIEGRLDASNSDLAEKMISDIKSENPGKHTVIDADNLEYISSAGLRLVLKLRKAEPKLAVINVAADVYEVFDMSGFTDMLTVERAYKRISIEGCEFIAKGANGAVYRYDEETIVKTYFAKDALPEIQRERENARLAFVLGVNTAIPYGIVRVGDGYGMVTELLNAVSMSKIIRNHPEKLTEEVQSFVEVLKGIHAIQVSDGEVPDMREVALDWASFVGQYLSKEQGRKLYDLIKALPKQNILLHGDYQTNNVMIRDGEPLLIDMDTLCMGHPVFELGSMFNALVGYSELDHDNAASFLGYSFETAEKIWHMTLKFYLDTEDEEVCQSVAEKATIIGYTRMLRRAARRPNEEESKAKIARCKEMLELLLNQVDTLQF